MRGDRRNSYNAHITQNAFDANTQRTPRDFLFGYVTQLRYTLHDDGLMNAIRGADAGLWGSEPPRHTLMYSGPGDSPMIFEDCGQHLLGGLPVLKRNTTQLERHNATLTQTNCGRRARGSAHQRQRAREAQIIRTHYVNFRAISTCRSPEIETSCPANEWRIAVTFGQRQGAILTLKRNSIDSRSCATKSVFCCTHSIVEKLQCARSRRGAGGIHWRQKRL
jgi:hypothetical protein